MEIRVPHDEIIVPNGRIIIPSLFMFDEAEKFYAFLHICKKKNCRVRFENEGIDILPDEDSLAQTVKLMCYTNIMICRKIGNDYVRYLEEMGNMEWPEPFDK